MKRINNLIGLFLFVFVSQISLFSQTYDDFYYTKKGKIYLKIVSNKYMVEFPNGVDENLFVQNNISYQKIRSHIYYVTSNLTTIQNVFGQSYFINPVYETIEGGYERKILNEIILKYKAGTDETSKNNLISFYNLQETKATRLYTRYKVNNSLQISKAIFESGLVEYCQPVFKGTPPTPYDGYIPNDTYFNKQFYLRNTGQLINDGHYGTPGADIKADEAWNLTKGNEDIVIAVIDDGLLADHPDIPISKQLRLPGSNIHSEFDPFNSDPNNPSSIWDPENSIYENHGNMCSGIVGAQQDNNEGISGVAPGCKIMVVKVLFRDEGQGDDGYDDAITFAFENGANIISISWGWKDAYECDFADQIIDAIEDAINGGCTIIVAARDYQVNNIGGIHGPVGFPIDEEIHGLIGVGASDRNDQLSNFSPISEHIDIASPSSKATPDIITGESNEIWSIDFTGNSGYNPWPGNGTPPPLQGEILPNFGTNNLAYTGRFGGTSAAAPQVAGCAALALSVNQNLSVNQINNLVKYKADKVGGYNYNWNSLIPGHSKELGYGRLNCYKIVETAQQMYTTDIDLYIRDTPDDFGIEPNEAGPDAPMWLSEDIWVRNQNDGLTNQVNENPVYSATNPVYVYVRVTNKGETSSYGSEELHLHWAKASAALPWPENWIWDEITIPLNPQ